MRSDGLGRAERDFEALLPDADQLARGALELGHPPARIDLVLDLRRLDAVLEYQPEDLTITVQAGCTAGAPSSIAASGS